MGTVIPVHLLKFPADMDRIMAIAARHGLRVVEDCAPAHASMYKGRKCGTIGEGIDVVPGYLPKPLATRSLVGANVEIGGFSGAMDGRPDVSVVPGLVAWGVPGGRSCPRGIGRGQKGCRKN